MSARTRKLCPACMTSTPVTKNDVLFVHYDAGVHCPMSGQSTESKPEPINGAESLSESTAIVYPLEPLSQFTVTVMGNVVSLGHKRSCQWSMYFDKGNLAEITDIVRVHLDHCSARIL